MFFLQTQDVDILEGFELRTSELIFQGRRFLRGLSFSKQLRQKAINVCREELDAGKLCIIIESDRDLTLWTENPQNEYKETYFVSAYSPPASSQKSGQIVLDMAFIELCRRKLTEYVISPIAERLLQKTLKNYPQIPPEQLVNVLAAQIPDIQEAQRFRQSILSS